MRVIGRNCQTRRISKKLCHEDKETYLPLEEFSKRPTYLTEYQGAKYPQLTVPFKGCKVD